MPYQVVERLQPEAMKSGMALLADIVPEATAVEQIGDKHFYIYLPNGWTVSVMWGLSEFLGYPSIVAPDGTADVLAFKGVSSTEAEQLISPEHAFTLEELVAFIREIGAK